MLGGGGKKRLKFIKTTCEPLSERIEEEGIDWYCPLAWLPIYMSQQKVLGQDSCQEEQDLGRRPRFCHILGKILAGIIFVPWARSWAGILSKNFLLGCSCHMIVSMLAGESVMSYLHSHLGNVASWNRVAICMAPTVWR